MKNNIHNSIDLFVPLKKLNKMLKYFFFTNAISTYLLKKLKLAKWDQQKNKPIKHSYEKKNNTKIIKKNRTLIYFTLIQLVFQIVFFIGIYIIKKYLYNLK
jgi:UDP-N-acetylmuramyl pentapeptide phosphotransferase/UDP-N-acetylglucosamine-1-phosphate transferase